MRTAFAEYASIPTHEHITLRSPKTGFSRCGGGQWADVKNFFRGKRFDLRFAQRDDGYRFAHRIGDFEAVAGFLSGTDLMMFDDSRDITAPKTVLSHVGFSAPRD